MRHRPHTHLNRPTADVFDDGDRDRLDEARTAAVGVVVMLAALALFVGSVALVVDHWRTVAAWAGGRGLVALVGLALLVYVVRHERRTGHTWSDNYVEPSRVDVIPAGDDRREVSA